MNATVETEATAAGPVAGDADIAVRRQLFEAFVGPNAAPFLKIFDRQTTGTKSEGLWRAELNVPGLVFTIPWLLYRKLYLEFLAFLAFTIGFGALEELIGNGTVLPWGSVIVLLFGNTYYVWRSRRRIARVADDAERPEALAERLRKSGGVSYAGAVLGALLTLALAAGTVWAVFQDRPLAGLPFHVGARGPDRPGFAPSSPGRAADPTRTDAGRLR